MANIDKDLQQIQLLREGSKRLETAIKTERSGFARLPGVSVLIPSYRSVDTLSDSIRSLAEQTLSPREFEVIVVFNGEDDGSVELLDGLKQRYSHVSIRSFHNSVAGAGAARNLALKLSRFEFITFVDADDYFEPRFLENAFEHARHDAIVASPILNLSDDGSLDEENALNVRIQDRAGQTHCLTAVPWILGFNACKLIPSELLIGLNYLDHLPSGEDLVFFANLLANKHLEVVFPPQMKDAAYIRRMKDDSVSRQATTFDFNVRQRTLCIQALRAIEVGDEELPARQVLERAQLGFVRRYLEEFPEDLSRLEAVVSEIGFLDFPWSWLNEGVAEDLVIFYCFLPYSDTSVVVAAKAVAERAGGRCYLRGYVLPASAGRQPAVPLFAVVGQGNRNLRHTNLL